MKLFLSLLLILTLNTWSFSQEVRELTFECLDDSKSGGRAIQPDTSGDTIKMSLKTYGPCKADFEVKANEVESSGIVNIIFDIKDRSESYQGGKLKCGCMYRLQFKIFDYKLKSNFRGWGVNNNTMPKKVWEEWYWSNID